jgi:hypothetical protein
MLEKAIISDLSVKYIPTISPEAAKHAIQAHLMIPVANKNQQPDS